MLYLDYAKPLAEGYILSFFADSVGDLESISHGQKFVTKNGTDYGVPQPGSTVIVTSPNSGKTTYVMDAEGIWVVTEDISYSAVVANPSDAATARLEKLKVNDTTYANWTQEEIKSIASESGGGKMYLHEVSFVDNTKYESCYFYVISHVSTPFTKDQFIEYISNTYGGGASVQFESLAGRTSSETIPNEKTIANRLYVESGPRGELYIKGILTYYMTSDTEIAIKRYANTMPFGSDTVIEL